MEQPMTMEQLIQKLQDSYRPHEDRGWLRTKAEQLRQDVSNISRQLQTISIRTLEDKEKLLSSYQRLAMDSIKTIMFVMQEQALLLVYHGQLQLVLHHMMCILEPEAYQEQLLQT